jgi:hypothetical protein
MIFYVISCHFNSERDSGQNMNMITIIAMIANKVFFN